MTQQPAPRRHRWGFKAVYPHKSERECLHGCGIVKVTHHQAEGGRDVHWTEFWRDGEKIEGEGTPACAPVQLLTLAGGMPAHTWRPDT